jgi:hypothetical protein
VGFISAGEGSVDMGNYIHSRHTLAVYSGFSDTSWGHQADIYTPNRLLYPRVCGEGYRQVGGVLRKDVEV